MLFRDLKFALRSLIRRPTFTVVAVLTLSLGIGGSTAIFSLVKTVILEPLSYPDTDELVMVWEQRLPGGPPTNVVNPGNFNDWRDQNTVFDGMAAFIQSNVNMTGAGDPQEVALIRSSPELFSVLGVEALVGRVYSAGRDDQESGVVVAGFGFWQRHAGGDPAFVGSTLTLSGRLVEVIGVLPPGADILASSADLWSPHVIPVLRRGRSLSVVARLHDKDDLERAAAEMSTIAGRLAEDYPEFNENWSAAVQPLLEHVVGNVRSALMALLAAVGLLLLIACANVANLLLGRAAGRRRELALRTSLGASRGQIIRQLLTESAVLGALGAAGGILVAALGIRWLVAMIPEDLLVPRLGQVAIDGELMLVTLVIGVLTTVLFGLLPSVDAARPDVADTMRAGGRSTESRSSGNLRSALVVAEVALSLVLLVGAGLMVRSFGQLVAVDSGVRPENVVTAHVNLRGVRYPDAGSRMAFFTELQDRVRAIPGVLSVGTNSFLPLTGIGSATSYYPEDQPTPSTGNRPTANMRFITGDYFQAMGIDLVEGRLIGDRDDETQPMVVVVNRTLARAHWPDGSPVGKRVNVGWGDDPSMEVVGVVGDVLHDGVRVGSRPVLYVPKRQLANFSFAAVVIRTDGPPAGVTRGLADAVLAIDPGLPLTRVRTMESVASAALAQPRLTTYVLAAFAVLALILAAVGIYGVMSFNVTRRVNEMGIRMALGARPNDVAGLVVRNGMRLAVLGVALGLVGSVLATRFLASMLFQVGTTDVATYATVASGLIAIALVACYLPARRATRVDPVSALRQE